MAEAAALAKAQKKLPPVDGLDIIQRLRQQRSFLTVPSFAVLTGETPGSVYRKVREKRLPHIRDGYSVKLVPQDMADFLEARRVRIAPVGAAVHGERPKHDVALTRQAYLCRKCVWMILSRQRPRLVVSNLHKNQSR